VNQPQRLSPDLEGLVSLFYAAPDRLARFQQQSFADLPPVYQRLLAHNNHMTVTVEQHHGSLVDVRVLEHRIDGHHYARKILLARQSDGEVVQYGIMRVNLAQLNDQVRREIESRAEPLGRILIRHNVLREVQLHSLWHVTPGEELARLFGESRATATFGRTALIYCDGEPAVELLEIVAPV
jgi:chorismate-pyruvate lyase